jgi:hypothetical protein
MGAGLNLLMPLACMPKPEPGEFQGVGFLLMGKINPAPFSCADIWVFPYVKVFCRLFQMLRRGLNSKWKQSVTPRAGLPHL